MDNVEYKDEVVVEEIFNGSFIIDQALTEEEQKQKVYDMMEEAGISVDNKEDLIIGYEGVEDNNGLSETQTTKFVVYKKSIKKVPLKTEDIRDKEVLEKQLEELKELRDKLVEKEYNSRRVEKATRKADKIKNKAIKTESLDNYKNELEKLDTETEKIEMQLKKDAKYYEDCYQELKEIIAKENQILNNDSLYSDEELKSIREEYAKLKIEVNEKSLEIKNKIDTNKKLLSALKRKKNSIKKDIEKKDALGLSYKEYDEITSTLRKRKIMDSILSKKGLDDIISKKASERTKEEDKLLKETKEEILKEITEYKKDNKETSILDSIEMLYFVEAKVIKVEAPRTIEFTKEEIDEMVRLVSSNPVKAIPAISSANYIPEETPEDMKETSNDNDEELKDNIEEKITLFYDENTNEYYVRENILDRFHIKPIEEGIKFEDGMCYKISEEDAKYIIDNKDNGYASYIINIENYQKEEKNESVSDDNVIPAVSAPEDSFLDSKAIRDLINDSIKEDENSNGIGAEVDTEVETKEETKVDNINEKIILYKVNDQIYAKNFIIKRFEERIKRPVDLGVRINKNLCFRIDETAVKYIMDNANNDYSPYKVEIQDAEIEKVEDFKFKNEDISEEFKNELKDNQYGYNIVTKTRADMKKNIIEEEKGKVL